MKKKLTALFLIAVLMFALASCGQKKEEDNNNEPADEPRVFHVGIVQLVQHPALDAATQGFQDALKEKLGDRVVFDVKNGSGEPANCTTIVNGFISDEVDLIMANATPAVAAAATATSDIPILGTSVTEYGAALDIANFNGTSGMKSIPSGCPQARSTRC